MKRVTILLHGRPITETALADRFFLRLRGLIGRDVRSLGGLFISPCGQIHTCFMSEPIDAVYLSREGEVLHIDAALPPNRLCRAVRGARCVLELPAGAAAELGIFCGAMIEKSEIKY